MVVQAAELKKMEQDRYYERRLAKERKEEDELYKDKDKYITSAYRKKMEEQKKWETLDKYVMATGGMGQPAMSCM